MSWETWQPGKTYRVPVAHGTWRHRTRDWVILGPRHEDAEFLDFPYQHWHLDPRFVPRSVVGDGTHDDWRYILGAPLMDAINPSTGWVAPRYIGIRRHKMLRQVSADLLHRVFAMASTHGGMHQLRTAYCGQHLRGTVCPHRGADLRGFEPDADGMVICPLHGLRFKAARDA